MKKVQRTSQPSAPSVKQLIKTIKINKYDYKALLWQKLCNWCRKGFRSLLGHSKAPTLKKKLKYMKKEN